MRLHAFFFFFLSLPALGVAATGMEGIAFEANPFGPVCEKHFFVAAQEYEKHKALLDSLNTECKDSLSLEVLPNEGWFNAVKAKFLDRSESPYGTEAADFLKRLGTRALEKIEQNNSISEAMLHCARHEDSWIQEQKEKVKKAIPEFVSCEVLLQGLRDLAESQGPKFRVANELVRQHGALTQSLFDTPAWMLSDMKGQFGFGFPAELRKLSDEEKALAGQIEKADTAGVKKAYGDAVLANQSKREEIDARHKEKIAELIKAVGVGDERTQAEFNLRTQEYNQELAPWFLDLSCNFRKIDIKNLDTCPSLNSRKSQFHMARFAKRSAELAQIVGAAPFVLFLSTDTPSDKELATAIEAVLKNGENQAAKTKDMILDKHFKSGVGVDFGPESTQQAINRRLDLMAFSPVLMESLLENNADCGTATSLVHYVRDLEKARKGVNKGLTTAAILLPFVGWGFSTAAGLSMMPAAVSEALTTAAIAASFTGQIASWSAAGMYYMSVNDSVEKYEDSKEKVLSLVHANPQEQGDGATVGDAVEFLKLRKDLDWILAQFARGIIKRHPLLLAKIFRVTDNPQVRVALLRAGKTKEDIDRVFRNLRSGDGREATKAAHEIYGWTAVFSGY
ncbi:MAG TPA: hypothetical protein VIH99_11735 [Bdellovibrionota bacterium]|jgi:hypothetical protein